MVEQHSSMTSTRAAFVAALLTAVVGLVALDSQSMWVDELQTWRLTQAASWTAWLDQLINWYDSDSQIPLYHLYTRSWVLLFPETAAWLRASNLPWLWGALFALLMTPVTDRRRWLPLTLAVLAVMHPFVWYYTNEMRPYIMTLTGAAIATSGLIAKLDPATSADTDAHATSLVIAGISLLILTSAIGAIWSVAFLLPSMWIAYRRYGLTLGLRKVHFALVGVALLLFAPIAWQYVDSFSRGVAAVKYYENTPANFLSGFYELAGLMGIGPGRDAMRSDGVSTLLPFVPALTVAALILITVFVFGVRALRQNHRTYVWLVLGCALVPFAVLYLLGIVKHWRVLGRHMTPVLPLLLLVYAWGLHALVAGRAPAAGAKRLLAAAFVGVMLVSATLVTRADRHQREDYIRASRLVLEATAKGQTVWWSAHTFGADYYGLSARAARCDGSAKAGSIHLLHNVEPSVVDGCAPPDVVVTSRPDSFDNKGAVSGYLTRHGFKMTDRWIGFQIWKK